MAFQDITTLDSTAGQELETAEEKTKVQLGPVGSFSFEDVKSKWLGKC